MIIAVVGLSGGYSITALCVLPKDETGVQFPLPAIRRCSSIGRATVS